MLPVGPNASSQIRSHYISSSSAHAASKMEELTNKIAETDQRLASQTKVLAGVGTEASNAQKEEMELRAEAMF